MAKAPLYVSCKGDRSAKGAVGHKEIVAQVQTWEGVMRVVVDKDGDYSIFIGEPTDIYGLANVKRIGWGNLNDLTWTEDVASRPDMDPMPLENRATVKATKVTKTASPVAKKTTVATPGAAPAAKAKTTGSKKFNIEDFTVGDAVFIDGTEGWLVQEIDKDMAGDYMTVEDTIGNEVTLRPKDKACPVVERASE